MNKTALAVLALAAATALVRRFFFSPSTGLPGAVFH
jgi:hypothetical protein